MSEYETVFKAEIVLLFYSAKIHFMVYDSLTLVREYATMNKWNLQVKLIKYWRKQRCGFYFGKNTLYLNLRLL